MASLGILGTDGKIFRGSSSTSTSRKRKNDEDIYVSPTVSTAPALSVIGSQPRTVQPTQTVTPIVEPQKKKETKKEKQTFNEAIKEYGKALTNTRTKEKGLSWENAITDMANIYEAKRNAASSIPVVGGLYDTVSSTAGNIATNMGEGAVKSLEGAADFASDVIFNPVEQRYNYAYDLLTKGKKTADENLEDLKKMQQRDIANDRTGNVVNNYFEALPNWENGSLIKRGNLGGQVAQGVGGMVPSLVLGQAFGGTPELSNLSGLTGKERLAAMAGNVGRTYMSQLPANAMLGASSYGSGVEQALNKGASMNQARAYGLANAAIEQGTEMLTGGVPGLEGKGGLDQFVEPLIEKTGKGFLNAFIKAGYGALGEGLEESAGTYLEALARKAILGEEIEWNEVNREALQSGLLGAITGAILNSPQTINDVQSARTNEKLIDEKYNVPELMKDPNASYPGDISAYIDEVIKRRQETIDNNINRMSQQNTVSEPTQMAQETQNVEERPITQETKKVPEKEVLEPITQREENIDNTQQKEYNEGVNEEGVQNDFRTIQEESRRRLNEESWGDSSKAIDEDLRGRIRGTLSEELKRRGYSDSNNDGLLKLEAKGNEFNLHKNVDADTFHDMFEIARTYTDNGELVDLHPVKTNEDSTGYEDMNNYITSDGMQGFSITKDGDVVSVFNADPSRKGFLRSIVGEINNNGKTLDCYNSSKQRLDEIYSKVFGWKTTSVMDHNMEYDHDNIAKNHNNPPVSFMVNPNQLKSDVTDADLNKKFGKDQYDEAVAYRSALMKGGEGNKNDFIFGEDGYFKGMKEGTSDSSFSNEQKEVKVLEEIPKETKKPLKERLRETRKKLTRDFISKGEAIESLSRKQKRPNLNYSFDRLGITKGEAQEHIGSMQRNLDLKPYKNFTDANGKKTTMSLNGIREDAKTHEIPESTLNKYLAEYRNVDTDKQGKPILNKSAEASMKVIEQIEAEHPEIKRIANNVWTFERNQLQDRVESGLIGKDFADELLKNNEHYVRIQRNVPKSDNNTATSSSTKGVAVNQQIDTLKGSDLDIMPIMESIAKYTEQVQQSMRMNQFGQELAKTLGVGSQDNTINSFTDEESFGVNPNLLQDDGKGNYTFTVFNDGNATVVPIDKSIYEALTPNKTVQTLENDETFKKITYAPKKMSEMFRTLTTDKNPVFMFTNAFRDIGDAPFNSKYTSQFLKTYASTEALRQVAGNGVYNQLYEAAGGKQNSYFNNGEFVDKTKSTASKVRDKLLMPIEKGNEIVESVPRMAEFIATIKANGYEVNSNGELVVKNKNKATKSANEVLNEALYNAAEITTNFKRGGDVAKMLNRNGATFLNASIQGFDKQVRNFTQIDSPKQAALLLTKALIFGIAPTMLNDAMWDDDDEYEELQEYQKDNYYLFKGKDGQWIRIPKGRAVSVIGGAFRRAKNLAKGDKKAFEGFGEFAANQVAPNSVLTNNIFAPLSQVKNNKSWSGNKIISDSMMKRPTEEQYNEKTDEISKAIGKAMKDLPLPEDMKNFKSPLAIHYLLDQYTGAIGDVILPMITEKSSSKYNPIIAPFVSKFTADSVYSNRTVGDYYDKKNELEIKKNSSKSTPLDAAKSSYMTSRNYEIADLYKQQKQIQSDTSLSNKEKYDKAREKQKEINKTAKDIMKSVDNVDEQEYYAKIGDYYYKKVVKDGEEKYVRDTSKKIPEGNSYALYDYFKEKYEKSKEEKK